MNTIVRMEVDSRDCWRLTLGAVRDLLPLLSGISVFFLSFLNSNIITLVLDS